MHDLLLKLFVCKKKGCMAYKPYSLSNLNALAPHSDMSFNDCDVLPFLYFQLCLCWCEISSCLCGVSFITHMKAPLDPSLNSPYPPLPGNPLETPGASWDTHFPTPYSLHSLNPKSSPGPPGTLWKPFPSHHLKYLHLPSFSHPLYKYVLRNLFFDPYYFFFL